MKIKSSLKSIKKRDLNSKLVRRRGRVYVINKTNPKLIYFFEISGVIEILFSKSLFSDTEAIIIKLRLFLSCFKFWIFFINYVDSTSSPN